MERLFVYILNVCLIGLLYSCREEKVVDYSEWTDKQKSEETKRLEYEKKWFFQGAVNEQAYLDTLIALNPDTADYYIEKSIANSKIGDYHIAIPLLEKAMEIDPKETLYYTSWLMTDLYKDYDRALLYLNQYDDYTPNKTDYAWGENVNSLKGEVLQALERHEEAIHEFTNVIKEEGDYVKASVYVYRGISYMHQKKYKIAISDFDMAIKLFDKSSMGYYYKGLTFLEMGNKKEAILAIEQSKKLIEQGYKASDPYKEVYNEIYLMQVEDKLKEITNNTL
ncbi:tetratricopeptide (TPR) repeat protein [Aquimarina sp. EL_43]|uniref:tetratricopeptide repeat protein n=1 Tax=unclassified Aquimarina TaxID=2627091 RepID=UPI0018CA035A|nr:MULTISPECIES: tetratricopeptide repeat protein [unclassified Aquimarina]MBG6128830.1 tetratricopeptide (TPR) repeat protein [Aquimarina sp. EL_35]MBG6149893.1 tetratricopeptide (TPR) repeat protein [Aquimarina sp. EL_32]MBG6167420.1 tetratricopeptide (TPR) repeat protein [Aquimarina sp. EL_43]